MGRYSWARVICGNGNGLVGDVCLFLENLSSSELISFYLKLFQQASKSKRNIMGETVANRKKNSEEKNREDNKKNCMCIFVEELIVYKSSLRDVFAI